MQGAQLDVREIVRRAVANELGPGSEAATQYNYVERIRVRNLDAEGRSRSTHFKVHEVLQIEGTPYRILIEEDGQAAPLADQQRQAAEIQRVYWLRKQQSAEQRGQRLAEHRKRQERYRKAIQEIPEAFDFRLVGEEILRGRSSYVIETSPKPGYRPVDRYSRLFTQVRGRLWIDRQELFWTKLEAELQDTVTFGWILVRIHEHSRARMTQMRVEGGVWLPERLWYQVALRVGLFRFYRLEEETEYGGYLRAQDDPRLAILR